MKTQFLFTCKKCGRLYEENSSTITIYDIGKEESYRSTKLCVCQQCLHIIEKLCFEIDTKNKIK